MNVPAGSRIVPQRMIDSPEDYCSTRGCWELRTAESEFCGFHKPSVKKSNFINLYDHRHWGGRKLHPESERVLRKAGVDPEEIEDLDRKLREEDPAHGNGLKSEPEPAIKCDFAGGCNLAPEFQKRNRYNGEMEYFCKTHKLSFSRRIPTSPAKELPRREGRVPKNPPKLDFKPTSLLASIEALEKLACEIQKADNDLQGLRQRWNTSLDEMKFEEGGE